VAGMVAGMVGGGGVGPGLNRAALLEAIGLCLTPWTASSSFWPKGGAVPCSQDAGLRSSRTIQGVHPETTRGRGARGRGGAGRVWEPLCGDFGHWLCGGAGGGGGGEGKGGPGDGGLGAGPGAERGEGEGMLDAIKKLNSQDRVRLRWPRPAEGAGLRGSRAGRPGCRPLGACAPGPPGEPAGTPRASGVPSGGTGRSVKAEPLGSGLTDSKLLLCLS